MGKLKVLLQIAFRNLFASWLNVIIGLVIVGGTFLVVLGGSALDSLERSMRGSIVGSVAGDIQVYSDKSEEDLSVFGDEMGEETDITPMENFAEVDEALSALPNVEAVVPMGFKTALISSGNALDVMLGRLRDQVGKRLEGDASKETAERIDSLKAHVRHVVRLMVQDRQTVREIIEVDATEVRDQEALDKASSTAFWDAFDQDPLGSLEFLENRIAPLLEDGDLLYTRYMGTDLHEFQRSFDRMEIVEGEMIPEGERGILLPTFNYEEMFKLKTARRLDKIKEQRDENDALIATDADLQRMVRENKSQTRDVLIQLDPLRTKEAVARLQKALKTEEADPEKLLQFLLDTNDQNFDERYKIFYAELVPLLELYRANVGDEITLKSFTDAGYLESANVKLYGTFQFRGLEKSPLAGVTALVDMMTFRDLYGFLTPQRRAEIARLKAQSGVKAVAREDAEAALFGGEAEIVAEGESATIDEELALGPRDEGPAEPRTFSREEINSGMVLNAAVVLEDDTRVEETLARIRQVSKDQGLGLKVVEGTKATGLLGQLIEYIRLALYVVALVIFVVAMVILSNAVLMATLQRVREIGTVRAIGAQKGFVRAMITVETVVLGTVFGGVGILLGAGVVALLGNSGIPATSDEAYFFFGGPRWHPTLSLTYVVVGYVVVLLVSLAATLYPALLATRVAPVEAMQAEE